MQKKGNYSEYLSSYKSRLYISSQAPEKQVFDKKYPDGTSVFVGWAKEVRHAHHVFVDGHG